MRRQPSAYIAMLTSRPMLARTAAKLLTALDHLLPDVRERVCWLIEENRIESAIPRLIHLADRDNDLFVRKAAFHALEVLRSRH